MSLGFLNTKDIGHFDYHHWGNEATNNDAKWYTMWDEVGDHLRWKQENQPGGVPTRSESMHTMVIMYKLPQKDIETKGFERPGPLDQFTSDSQILYRWGLLHKDKLKQIDKVESYIKRKKMWPELCLASSKTDTSCSAFSLLSPIDILKSYGPSVFDFSKMS